MDLPSSDEIYALKVDEFDTSKLLTNAARQRDALNLNSSARRRRRVDIERRGRGKEKHGGDAHHCNLRGSGLTRLRSGFFCTRARIYSSVGY